MTILYLYSRLNTIGYDYIKCLNLVKFLNKKYNLILKYAIISEKFYTSDYLSNKSLIADQLISEDEFLSSQFKILIIENKLKVINGILSEKVNSEVIRKFLNQNGIVIFLFRDDILFLQEPHIYNQFLKNSRIPLIKSVECENSNHSINNVQKNALIIGYDEYKAIKDGYHFEINVYEEYLSKINPKILPIYDGINKIVVNIPIQIDYIGLTGTKILLTGNKTTKLITSNQKILSNNLIPVFGAYNNFYNGISIILTGGICDDVIVQNYKTDSIKFINNLIDFLLKFSNFKDL